MRQQSPAKRDVENTTEFERLLAGAATRGTKALLFRLRLGPSASTTTRPHGGSGRASRRNVVWVRVHWRDIALTQAIDIKAPQSDGFETHAQPVRQALFWLLLGDSQDGDGDVTLVGDGVVGHDRTT